MKLNLPKVNIPWNLNFVIAVLLLYLIGAGLHEFGHYMVAKTFGQDIYLTFSGGDYGIAASPMHDIIVLIAGPLVTYSLLYLGLFLLLFSMRFKLIGVILVFLSGFQIFSPFDEAQIFSILRLEPNLIYLYKIPLILIPFIIAYLSIDNKRKYLSVGALFILSGLFFGVLIVQVIDGTFFIGPLKEGAIFPNIFGINIYMIVSYITALALFFGIYVQYLLPSRKEARK